MNRTIHAGHFLAIGVLTLALLMIPARDAGAQVLIGLLFGDKVSTEKFHLGINVGANFANLSGIDGTKARTGFIFGLLGEWRFAENFYLQPELLPFYAAGAKNLPPEGLDIPELDPLVTDKKRQRQTNYFAIPVVVKYGAMNRRLHLGVGGQIGFLTSATDRYEGVVENRITIENDIEEHLAGTDAGLVFHVEYKMAPSYGTGINVRYYLGLTDTIKDNPGDAVYNRIFSVFVSVPLGNAPEQD